MPQDHNEYPEYCELCGEQLKSKESEVCNKCLDEDLFNNDQDF